MFDTMIWTKIVGGFCGAFLVFLLGGWAAQTIYGAEHGDHEQAYVIEVESDEVASGEVVEEGPPFADLLAVADAAAGEDTFGRACGGCHKIADGVNGTGPHLYGVVNRPVQAVADFDYSGALIAVNDVWTPESINAFITDPGSYADGTKMAYNGMRSAEDRANVVAYLATIGG